MSVKHCHLTPTAPWLGNHHNFQDQTRTPHLSLYVACQWEGGCWKLKCDCWQYYSIPYCRVIIKGSWEWLLEEALAESHWWLLGVNNQPNELRDICVLAFTVPGEGFTRFWGFMRKQRQNNQRSPVFFTKSSIRPYTVHFTLFDHPVNFQPGTPVSSVITNINVCIVLNHYFTYHVLCVISPSPNFCMRS